MTRPKRIRDTKKPESSAQVDLPPLVMDAPVLPSLGARRSPGGDRYPPPGGSGPEPPLATAFRGPRPATGPAKSLGVTRLDSEVACPAVVSCLGLPGACCSL
jgi:hypothetical protein